MEMATIAITRARQELLDRLIDCIASSPHDLDSFKPLLEQLDSSEIDGLHSATRRSPLETLFSRYPQITEQDLDILESLSAKGADLNKVDDEVLRKMMETEVEKLNENVKKFELRLIRKFAELDTVAKGIEGVARMEPSPTQVDTQPPLITPLTSLPSSVISSPRYTSHRQEAIPAAPSPRLLSRPLSKSPIPRSSVSTSCTYRRATPDLANVSTVLHDSTISSASPLDRSPSSPSQQIRLFVFLPQYISYIDLSNYFAHTLQLLITIVELQCSSSPCYAIFDIAEEVFTNGDLTRKIREVEGLGQYLRRTDGRAWKLKVDVFQPRRHPSARGASGGSDGGIGVRSGRGSRAEQQTRESANTYHDRQVDKGSLERRRKRSRSDYSDEGENEDFERRRTKRRTDSRSTTSRRYNTDGTQGHVDYRFYHSRDAALEKDDVIFTLTRKKTNDIYRERSHSPPSHPSGPLDSYSNLQDHRYEFERPRTGVRAEKWGSDGWNELEEERKQNTIHWSYEGNGGLRAWAQERKLEGRGK